MAKALRRTLIVAAAAALPVGAIIGVTVSANAATSLPAHYAAPYLQIGGNTANDMITGMNASGDKFYTLAFLIPKSGCTSQWEFNGDSLGAFTGAVSKLQGSGGNVIISHGGADGGELAIKCTSVTSLTAAYRNELSTYPGVKRLDFDIEGGTLSNTGANDRRAKALAALQNSDPSVQVQFTVATDPGGMPPEVMNMLKNAVSNGVKISLVNIMTMDFGNGQNALNDGLSASKAAEKQVKSLLGLSSDAAAWAHLGATFISGPNDDNENFTPGNASTFESFAASNGMGELSFWELAYDKTHGWTYSKTFNKITGGTQPPPTTTPPTTKPPTSPPPTGAKAYVGTGSGKCIDDPASNIAAGTQLEIWACNGGSNQALSASGGTMQILGKCLTANGTANNTAIVLETCNGGANQKFSYNSSSKTIVDAQSGTCVTVQSLGTTNGSKLLLYTCNGKTNQGWTPQ